MLLLLHLAAGCASMASHEKNGEYVAHARLLAYDLNRLADNIDPAEAKRLAETALTTAHALAVRYGLAAPPLVHNILVNTGMKKRGLCVHWAEDMLAGLRPLGLASFEFHWGIANRKKLFAIDHSSVIVTAKGQPFQEGIVLDPWRNGGLLYWGKVKTDSYQWEKLE